MHTSVSQHAYRTLDEMAMAAKFKGFKAFGITNHGPGMLDGAMELHFLCLRNLPDELYGIRFYKGAEVNIKSGIRFFNATMRPSSRHAPRRKS